MRNTNEKRVTYTRRESAIRLGGKSLETLSRLELVNDDTGAKTTALEVLLPTFTGRFGRSSLCVTGDFGKDMEALGRELVLLGQAAQKDGKVVEALAHQRGGRVNRAPGATLEF